MSLDLENQTPNKRDLENQTPNKCFRGHRRGGEQHGVAPRNVRRVAKNGAVRAAGCASLKDAETIAVVSDDVRKAVACKVDEEVQEKLRQVWQICTTNAKQVQVNDKHSHEQISKSVTDLTSAQDALASEYRNLRQVVSSMSDFLSNLCPGSYTSQEPCITECGSADSCSTASTCATPRCDWSQVGFGLPGLHATEFTSSTFLGDKNNVGQAQAPNNEELKTVDLVLNYLSSGSKQKKHSNKLASKPPLTTLSLAAALGLESPQEETRFVPIATRGQKANSVCEQEETADAYIFALTLRVAETFELGLCLSPQGSVLRVQSILPHSAVEAWNEQCVSNKAPERMLKPGDQIVSVNDVADDVQAMIDECRRKLLKMQVLRTAGAGLAEQKEAVPTSNAMTQTLVSSSPFPKVSSLPPASASPSWPTPFADGSYKSLPSSIQPLGCTGSCFGVTPLGQPNPEADLPSMPPVLPISSFIALPSGPPAHR